MERTPPTHCTCGATLVADSLFCHRCGRPVYEDLLKTEPDYETNPDTASPGEQSVMATPTPPPPAAEMPTVVWEGPPEPIDLRNRMAVRLGILAAALQFPLFLLPFPVVLKLLLVVAGGYFAASTYQRRTESHLDFKHSFRLGWIAGLFLFLLLLGIYAITFSVLSFSGNNLESLMAEAMKAGDPGAFSAEQATQLREIFSDSTKLFTVLLLTIVVAFVSLTGLSGIGGALVTFFRGRSHRA